MFSGFASADGDNERPKQANKVLFGDLMLDQANHRIGPTQRVLDRQLAAVDNQEFYHRDKGSAFIALLERVRLGNASQ